MKQVGPYQLLEEVARGGMGVVYRAHDPRIGRDVALKVLLGYEGLGDEDLERFRREARALGRLKHPAVVGVHELGWERGKPYLVMDFVPGEPLWARLKREGPLDSREAAALFAELADALQMAHGAGILHRDLKPENVLISPEGRPVLVDFGLAKLRQDGRQSLTQTGTVMGTPAYMSPEQARGDIAALGPETDVYGLGATLYAALTARPPFLAVGLAALAQVAHDAPTPAQQVNPAVDPALAEVCARCLAKEPADRYPSCSALAEALRATSSPLHPSVGRARAWLAGLVGLGLLTAVVVASAVGPARRGAVEPATHDPPKPTRALGLQRQVREGNEAWEAGDMGLASIHYEHVLREDPSSPEALLGRARLRARSLDGEGALADLRAMGSERPLEALVFEAEILASLDRFSEAMESCQEAARLDAEGSAAACSRGFVHMTQARRLLAQRSRAGNDPEAVRAATERVEAALSEARIACEESRRLVEAPSDAPEPARIAALDAWIHTVSGNVARQDGDRVARLRLLQEAVELASAGLKQRPFDRGLRLALIVALIERGQFDEAIQVADEQLELQPRNAEFVVHRGSLLRQQKKFDQALAEFARAVALWPTYPIAYGNRAELFMEQVVEERQQGRGDSERARAAYESARRDVESMQRLCPASAWVQTRVDMFARLGR